MQTSSLKQKNMHASTQAKIHIRHATIPGSEATTDESMGLGDRSAASGTEQAKDGDVGGSNTVDGLVDVASLLLLVLSCAFRAPSRFETAVGLSSFEAAAAAVATALRADASAGEGDEVLIAACWCSGSSW